MKRHQIQTCKGQEQKHDIVGDIINKAVQRADMGVKPMTKKSPSYLPKKPVVQNVVPIEVVNAIKPKSLTDLAVEIEGKSDSEHSDSEDPVESSSENESESDDMEMDYEFMPDNPDQLKKAFKNLYEKLQHNMDTYNKLVLMLDELHRIDFLTREECEGMKDHLQKKIGIQ